MEKTLLLQLHMNCNQHYIYQHAEIAGLLATKQLKTFKDYENKAKSLGIEHYREEVFNKFMNIS